MTATIVLFPNVFFLGIGIPKFPQVIFKQLLGAARAVNRYLSKPPVSAKMM